MRELRSQKRNLVMSSKVKEATRKQAGKVA